MDKIKVAILNPTVIKDAEAMMVCAARLTQRGHKVKDLQDFDAILDRLPQEVRYTLDRKAADRAIETYYGGRDT